MIRICKNSNGDTRTAKKDVTFEEFQKANDMHRQDVRNVMTELGTTLSSMGKKHDHTKKSHERMFYRDFLSTMNEGSNFVTDEWYQLHIKTERHHLLSRCPNDVDLLDVIEMIVDCVCAGKSRSGEVRPIEIDDEILKRALKNTVAWVDNIIECVE